jgi:hypothetical protein
LTIHDSLLSVASGNPFRNCGRAKEIIDVSIAIMNAAMDVTARVSHELRGIMSFTSSIFFPIVSWLVATVPAVC